MLFEVIDWSDNSISNTFKRASFYLERDSWNDWHYYTYYHLHLSAKHTDDGEPRLIGGVKILKKHQSERQRNLIPLGEYDILDASFCSLGQSLDYYERIAQISDVALRDKILDALRDIVIHPDYRKDFEDDAGWKTSLFRSVSISDDIFTIAPMFIARDFHKLPSIDLEFKFQVLGLDEPITFDFDSPGYGYDDDKLPNRIIVIIGRNGSGKSTLLSKLSRICYASTSDRKNDLLQPIGIITPVGLGFPRIVNLSYSAFDSFQIPGISKKEKEQIAKDIRKGIGRYIFCGIRDIAKELEESLPELKTDEFGRLLPEHILEEKHSTTYLKRISDLAVEFANTIERISDENKVSILDHAIDILSEETSLHNIQSYDFMEHANAENQAYFMNLSTGHKFVLHSVFNIVAYTDARSLVLFDEPETHLHPPILAVLMKAIRYVLKQQNAFMILATHSPVVLQETLKKHVHILSREDTVLKSDKPSIQTYGENIGLITSSVFNLSSDITDYHTELDKIIENIVPPKNTTKSIIDMIEDLFDGDLSMQARAYILSKTFDEE
jgi:predicted ATPase